ncbi:MAG: SIS domain-containing protein [Actinobacteria bacterium]|nr:SIS domain-containing protein [Actinomycetota bacterium]
MEELIRIPIHLELASDFLDRSPAVLRNDTCIFISQSGETADTIKALEYCKARHALCVGITNVAGSTIARMTHCGVNLNCGPEIGVASTKAYTSQIVALILTALFCGDDTTSTLERRIKIIQELSTLPHKIQK